MSTLRPPPGGAVVRMYNDSGFGDCFLLGFPRDDGGVATMVIDCGEWKRRKDVLTAMSSAVADAADNRIDVLVATHEHTDHLSGFNSARDVWDAMEVGQVWLSWLDDPSNDLARRLRNAYGKKLRAVAAALDRWEASLTGLSATAAAAARQRIASVRDVLAFEAADVLGAAGTATIAQAIEYLRTRGEEDVRYLHPGQTPLTIPGVSNVRVYVLGPPEDEDAITDLDPDPDDPETYEIALALTADAAFLVAAEYGAAGTEPEVSEIRRTLELSYPFERHHRVPVADARASFAGSYFRRDAWRRIDADWLETSEQLALHLNSYTNNTSLAIAIELVDSGRVLLFPADAQVGNWLSWQDVAWKDRGDGQPCTARDLLERTVLYKVGHHGSHNATLRELGLELMQHEDLVALIPVDEEFARGQHRPWNMPFPPLYRALRRRAKGRVLRSDRGRLPSKPSDVSAKVWDRFRADTMHSSGSRDGKGGRKGDGYWEVVIR